MSVSGKRVARFLLGVIGTSILISTAMPIGSASAAQITSRSLTLQAGASDGGSAPGGVVNHYFQFTLPSVGAGNAIGSIQFLYCTTAGGTCSPVTGLVTTGAGVTIDTTGSDIASGWTLNNTTNGSPYIHLASATAPTTGIMKVKLLAVTNPTTANQSFYVRISTFASLDTSGTAIDTGTVAASTANPIVLKGTMPESLIFCTGATITITSNIPDCSSASASSNIQFSQLFSTTSTAYATSQMAASTNALSGYTITVSGPTMTFGSNTIPAIGSTATASTVGIGQFGMNLRTDTTPAVIYFDASNGDVAPASDGVNRQANPATAYNTVNSYAFVAGGPTVVANSDYSSPGTASHPSDTQRYTATYIVNVAGHQAAGTYQTTLTYICTPTF